MLATTDHGENRPLGVGPLRHHLPIADPDHAIAHPVQHQISPPIGLEGIVGRMETVAVQFDDKPVANQHINVPDACDWNLRVNPDAAAAESVTGEGLESRLTSRVNQAEQSPSTGRHEGELPPERGLRDKPSVQCAIQGDQRLFGRLAGRIVCQGDGDRIHRASHLTRLGMPVEPNVPGFVGE